MNAEERITWDEDDTALEAEFLSVLETVRAENHPLEVPGHLDRKVLQLLREQQNTDLADHWLLGQGPRLILVTCILFLMAMFWLVI